MRKATEFSLNLPDIPGALNDVCVALSKYDVNIQSIAGVATRDCTLAMITDDEIGARKAFDDLGAEYVENETLTMELPDQSGALSNVTRVLTDANVNISAIYILNRSEDVTVIAFRVDNPELARQVLNL
tara:strand:+ start:6925 stop:7311 length:387 start_codon:yes stop_codon:yes gene_type:complete